MSNETENEYPPGSTAKIYHDIDGNKVTLYQLVKLDTEWAKNRIVAGEIALSQLATIERDTAEKCAFIAHETIELKRDVTDIYGEKSCSSIREYFNIAKGK